MTIDEVRELPDMYARTALQEKITGFGGVHIHAGHGFPFSQFLSPLFNHRSDGYGGSIEARCRIVLEVINKVRHAVGPSFPVGIRLNSTDQLEDGLTGADALEVVRLLDQTSIDLIDISGGTYFPGAKDINGDWMETRNRWNDANAVRVVTSFLPFLLCVMALVLRANRGPATNKHIQTDSRWVRDQT